ncbi:MAG TPA: class I SAM-dependent methyltransferase [Actinospica sp.]|nr:class I SAM-dependent methyltransferase [Actinospica sp.]
MTEVPLPTRLFTAMLGAYELSTVYLGVRLGCYAALAEDGPANAAELAERCGIHPRYAREWLEQQAVAGFLAVDDSAAGASSPVSGSAPGSASASARVYALPKEHVDLADPEGPLAAMALMHAGIGSVTARLVDAYRSGTGLAYGEYGADVRAGQAGFVRETYRTLLPAVLRAAVSAMAASTSTITSASATTRTTSAAAPEPAGSASEWVPDRIIDFGCGAGWSSLALAAAFPDVRIEGLDSDSACIEQARTNAAAAGVAHRVSFEVCDAAEPVVQPASAGGGERYDVALFCDVLHDLARPVEALVSARKLLTERGFAVVVDEPASDIFTAPGDQLQRGLYVASVLHCLPVGMAEQPSAATGALMRPDTLRGYAREAGFARVQELPAHDGSGMRAYLLAV